VTVLGVQSDVVPSAAARQTHCLRPVFRKTDDTPLLASSRRLTAHSIQPNVTSLPTALNSHAKITGNCRLVLKFNGDHSRLPPRCAVREICALLGFYAVWIGSFLRTFRDNLTIPSSTAQIKPHLAYLVNHTILHTFF
jgi:hypothetical protein